MTVTIGGRKWEQVPGGGGWRRDPPGGGTLGADGHYHEQGGGIINMDGTASGNPLGAPEATRPTSTVTRSTSASPAPSVAAPAARVSPGRLQQLNLAAQLTAAIERGQVSRHDFQPDTAGLTGVQIPATDISPVLRKNFPDLVSKSDVVIMVRAFKTADQRLLVSVESKPSGSSGWLETT